MNWKEYWNKNAEADSPLLQVGREENAQKFSLTLTHLESLIQPNKEKVLLDVCCGNGLVGKHFASKVRKLIGVDISESLLEKAREHLKEFSNVSLFAGRAEDIEKLIEEEVDVILLHFSFQYIESEPQALKVLKGFHSLLKDDGRIYITDIPNHYKARVFYNGTVGRLRYWKQSILGGDMGKFWKPERLVALCQKAGLKVEVLPQPDILPYSHYRFDMRLHK